MKYLPITILALFVFSIANFVNAQSPKIDWATYYSGQLTSVNSVVYDEDRSCIYILGYTADTIGIATLGSHKSSSTFYSSEPSVGEYLLDTWNSDIFLAKFDLNGNRIWGTYFGGNGIESFPSMCLDKDGNIIIAGSTTSTSSIATPGTFRPNTPVDSGYYGFVAKFDPDGNQIWGTYIHADVYNVETDRSPLIKLACDKDNNIYLSGPICLGNSYTTPGAYQETLLSENTEFIMKLNPNGQRVWGTYYNDSGEIFDICVSKNNNLYVTGTSRSYLPGTVGVYQPNNLATEYFTAGFISKFDLSGSRIWHTYISSDEYTDSANRAGIYPFSIAVDTFDNIYVYGEAYKVDSGIATPGVFQESYDDYYLNYKDLFVMKFNSTGSRIWGTYYGGPAFEKLIFTHYQFGAQKICVTNDGESILISGGFGYENSGTGIEYGCSEIDVSSKTGFIARFNSSGNAVWSTYYNDRVMDIAIAALKNEESIFKQDIYFVTRTEKNGLATIGSHKDNKLGLLYSGLIGKIIEVCPTNSPIISYASPNLTVDGDYESYTWYHNGVAVSSGASESYTPGADTTGYYYAKVSKCGCEYITDTFYFDEMGIGQLEFQRHFRLYPNPTKDAIQLEIIHPNLKISVSDIQVFNVLGQVQQIPITITGDNKYTMNLGALPAGSYHLQIRHQAGVWSQPVLKW